MDTDAMLDDLDRQFKAFLTDLEIAFRDARNGIRNAPLVGNGINRYVLCHLSWNDGEAINVGIMVQGWAGDEADDE